MKFRDLARRDAGQFRFSRPNEDVVVMPKVEAVECPDWLAAKLATNSHFAAVTPDCEETVADDKSIKDGMGECPDCGGVFRLSKDGLLYRHT